HGGTQRDLTFIESPSLLPQPMPRNDHGYPTFPWEAINDRFFEKGDPAMGIWGGEAPVWGGPILTDTVELPDRLFAVGYGQHRGDADFEATPASRRYSVFCYESTDRGHTWRELSMAARGTEATPEGFDEPTVLQ